MFTVDADIGTITVNLPKACSIIGNTIKIGTSTGEGIHTNFTKDEKITIMPIKIDSPKPYDSKNNKIIELYKTLEEKKRTRTHIPTTKLKRM